MNKLEIIKYIQSMTGCSLRAATDTCKLHDYDIDTSLSHLRRNKGVDSNISIIIIIQRLIALETQVQELKAQVLELKTNAKRTECKPKPKYRQFQQ